MKNTPVAIRARRLSQAKFRLSELVYVTSLFYFEPLHAQSWLFALSKRYRVKN